LQGALHPTATYQQSLLQQFSTLMCSGRVVARHVCCTLLLQVLAHGKAVLGFTVLGPVALLLLAEAVRVSGVLPGGHEIKTVTQSKWHRINLQV
jgi:hypothetical protein